MFTSREFLLDPAKDLQSLNLAGHVSPRQEVVVSVWEDDVLFLHWEEIGKYQVAETFTEELSFERMRGIVLYLHKTIIHAETNGGFLFSNAGWVKIYDILRMFNDSKPDASWPEDYELKLPTFLHAIKHSRHPSFEILGTFYNRERPHPVYPYVCIEPLLVRLNPFPMQLEREEDPCAYSLGIPHKWMTHVEFGEECKQTWLWQVAARLNT